MGKVIPLVEVITPELRSFASGPATGGRGGMLSKLDAAELAMRSGGVAVIASGRRSDTIERLFAGEQIGTTFISASRTSDLTARLIGAAKTHHIFDTGTQR